MYEISFRRSALKEIKKLDKPIRQKDLAKIEECAENPFLFKRLTGDLRSYYSAHCTIQRTQYRIIYEIFEETIMINILMVGTRENLYEALKKRID
ncbi:type II toxin-antitoxin system RelE family toxin [Dehalobacterium formicoaceticum]|uniref:Type II toxin-antitoxin system RelE/ParE family toxin n=1 Tax=Dehalobacterium formicoaceticum TaxID=51515 RepID=A0ABT1YAP1_9FIRM|nr:type II toxin-antitoxin system mRNA interferase toxin, RelE/StbE family [Dehalobacterium formicoaceticum]MCR6546999.1 type II toxin-antitoxin system RelE/ParE family toxin [Dehalobacterium formicoaceticum]